MRLVFTAAERFCNRHRQRQDCSPLSQIINVSDVKLTRVSFNNGVTVSVRGRGNSSRVPTMPPQHCLDVATAQNACDHEAVSQDENLVAIGNDDRHRPLDQPL
jgi:hypothetical protein